jgi:hypothetical protein
MTGRATRTTETQHREPAGPKWMDLTAYPWLVLLALTFCLFQVCLTIDKGVPAGKNGMVRMAGALAGGSWSELQHSQVAIMSMGTTAVNSSQNHQRQRSISWGQRAQAPGKRRKKRESIQIGWLIVMSYLFIQCGWSNMDCSPFLNLEQ